MNEPMIERGTCSECGGPTERGPSGAWWHLNPACYAGQFPAPLVTFQPTPEPATGDHVNVRLIAGVTILALLFAAWFVTFALDEGWLVATISVLGIAAITALIGAAVKLISDGMDRR